MLVEHCDVKFGDKFTLKDISWQLEDGCHWAILGANGAGKSAFAAMLMGEGEVLAGSRTLTSFVECVSFETQAELIERERSRDDSDLNDEVFTGTLVKDIIAERNSKPALMARLIEQFSLSGLLQSGFRTLSTGETRKVMLVRALASEPQVLILDEPYDGLDQTAVAALNYVLSEIIDSVNIVMVLNRLTELPDFLNRLMYLETGSIKFTSDTICDETLKSLLQLQHISSSDLEIPAVSTEIVESRPTLSATDPLVRMRKVRIAYGDKVIFDNLDWTVSPGEHWQVTGPNGSGKTCLLNLVTGDHPQSYVNDIFIFGFQRGQGETIWDIKQHIGYVSTALQWEYRVSTNILNVILSGFYDSIGLYQKPSETEQQIAHKWLAILGLASSWDQSFKQMSFGTQRLLLIARAMVKLPPLLILDEPCLGLDEMHRQLVLALIEKICKQGQTTVIYVNHHREDKIKGIHHFLNLEGGLNLCSQASL